MRKKRRSVVQTFAIVLFPVILLGIGLFLCCHKNGFSMHKISSQLSYSDQWNGAVDYGQERELVDEVFEQPFYYLSSGQQCYAFISKDQKYVLKFFKMHKLIPKTWIQDFPSSLFRNARFNDVQKKKYVLESTFAGIKVAFDYLKDQSALIYIHLNKTKHLKKRVQVFDKLGVRFDIDLDSKEFIVDATAELLYPRLLRLSELKDEEKIRQSVLSLFDLIATRCQRGFADQELVIWNNYGFIGDCAVLIDCGKLFADSEIVYSHNYKREIVNVCEAINDWAQKNCPMVSPILQKELQCYILLVAESENFK